MIIDGDNRDIISVIDIGTYSVRLLIAAIHRRDSIEDTVRSVDEIVSIGRITSLGRNVKKTKVLEREAIEETIAVLREYVAISREYRAKKIVGFATEACRIAKNGDTFLKRVRDLGIDVSLIDGQREAHLSFLATAYSLNIEGRFIVIDQGGGSTEFAYGKKNKELSLIDSVSMPFGIVNLTEEFFKNDPPTEEEVNKLKEYLRGKITDLIKIMGDTDYIVGLGGTITTLVALERKIYPYNSKKVHGSKLSKDTIKKWLKKLISIPTVERQKYPQIEDKRAKVLPSGILIFDTTLEIFGKEEIIVSDRGLRYGALIEYILKNLK